MTTSQTATLVPLWGYREFESFMRYQEFEFWDIKSSNFVTLHENSKGIFPWEFESLYNLWGYWGFESWNLATSQGYQGNIDIEDLNLVGAKWMLRVWILLGTIMGMSPGICIEILPLYNLDFLPLWGDIEGLNLVRYNNGNGCREGVYLYI